MTKKKTEEIPEKKSGSGTDAAPGKAGKTGRKKAESATSARKTAAGKKIAPKTASKKTAEKSSTKKEAARLRRRAEAKLASQKGRLAHFSDKEKDELIHELGTYQIELEIQNEELRRAQTELELSRTRLADLYNQAPVGYFTFDSLGRITSVNLTGARMLDATSKTLVNKIFSLFVHPHDSDKLHLHLRLMLKEKSGQNVELRLQPGRDGPERHVKLESIPALDEAGKVLEIRSTVSDITQRIKAQAKLVQKNALLRAIIDHTDVQMAYLDPDFNFIWINKPYAENSGMEPQEVAGKNHFEFFPHEENEEIFRQVRDTRGTMFYKDKPFRYQDQPERGLTYWDWTLAPVQAESGEVIGLVLSLRETTKFKKAQLALEENEARFRTIAETSIDIIFQVDYTGSVLYVSSAVRSLGYSPEDVIGRPFRDFVASEDVTRTEKTFRNILAGKRIELKQFKMIHKEGHIVPLEVNASPMIQEGAITAVQGIARDITERLLTEEKIKQLARFPAENPFPVMRLSKDGLILYANAASSPLLTQWQANTGEPVPDEIMDLVLETRESGKILEVEQTCGNRILTLNLVPIYDGSFVNVYSNDITDRKRSEELLLEAKQDWENTFDAVPDLIAILDQDHRITRVNRSMAEKLGVAPDELIGQKCYECCHGRTEPVDNCPHMLLLGDKKEHSLELSIKRLGGYFLITTTPLFDEHKNINRSIHVARDITGQKEAEAKIMKLNRDLQISMQKLKFANENLIRSNEDLQHFASIVSHDLQEPLRTVSSFVQLIARRYEEMLDEKGQVFIQHVVEGTTHMQRLLNDLLGYSRVGGGELEKRIISLEKVLKNVKRNLDRKIKESRAVITSTALPELSCDELQFFTLLQNLISNAIKYRSRETPRINISATQNNENEWLFCVQDNGIGFEPKHAEQIFLIFQRLHLRNEYAGTGIGLAVCKKIVERHGGRIWAESVPGRGTSVYFTLPAEDRGDDE